MVRTDKQMVATLVAFALAVGLCGLAFVASVERMRAKAQVSEALNSALADFTCATQENGTVTYTKVETNSDSELAAEIGEILEGIQFEMLHPVYNEVSIDDWLTVTGRDATNAQAIYVTGQGEIYAPSNTLIISRELPTVVETNGGWAITFGQ